MATLSIPALVQALQFPLPSLAIGVLVITALAEFYNVNKGLELCLRSFLLPKFSFLQQFLNKDLLLHME